MSGFVFEWDLLRAPVIAESGQWEPRGRIFAAIYTTADVLQHYFRDAPIAVNSSTLTAYERSWRSAAG